MALEPRDIRTLTLVGHTGSGKTLLAEAMLLAGGSIRELGSIEKGTTVSDSTPEEKEAGASVTLSVVNTTWSNKHIQVLDAPGYMDFSAQALAGLVASDLALITVNAVAGIEVTTRKMWERAEQLGLPRMFVVTRLDNDNANFEEVVESLRTAFGPSVTPISRPIGTARDLSAVEDLVHPKGELSPEAAAMRETLLESAVSSDDALLEKYLGGEEIPEADIERVMRKSLVSRALVPVAAVSAAKGLGVDALLGYVASYGPTPFDDHMILEDGSEFTPSPEGPLVARVFKVMSDDYVGKVSFLRIYQGSVKAGSVIHTSKGDSAKLAKLFRFQGKDQKEVTSAVAGEIVATSKVDELAYWMSCWDAPDAGPILAEPKLSTPMVAKAIEPKTRGDEGKISDALRKLSDEDPGFDWRQDPQTHETVIAGMGDRHLRVMLERMKKRFQLEVNTKPPKIAYRETIAGTATVRYRHKKQSGGSGQFAECEIMVEPNERGAGYEFVDDIFGGSIDLQYRPSVDKGVQQQMHEGILAGFEVVDIKVHLVDGKTHPVDSKDIAFQIAGRQAIKEAVMKAKPVLLEPVVDMEIVVPPRFMGDITGDISGRRGRISGMEQLGDLQVVKAQVPASEVQTYSAELQALTGGEGYFSMEFSHYEPAPSNVMQQIIASHQKKEE